MIQIQQLNSEAIRCGSLATTKKVLRVNGKIAVLLSDVLTEREDFTKPERKAIRDYVRCGGL